MSLIHYLLEANLYLAAFYLLYYLFLSRETHYQLNRAYLLSSTLLAFAIPFIQLGILSKPVTQVQNNGITIITAQTGDIPDGDIIHTAWPAANYLLLVYGIIALLFLSHFLLKIYKLIRLSHSNKTAGDTKFKLIELPDENNAFSFFNYLFISPGLSLSPTVINHELIHIRQKHSWDIMYLELFKIINWFNPVAYLLQNSMKEVHEFIADSQTAGLVQSAEVYTDFLVNNAYGINENTLINTFFNQSLLKKRIMMLHQKRSGKAARLKYLLALPLICGLLCVSTLGFGKAYALIDLAPRHGIVASRTPKKALPDTITKNRMRANAITSKGYKFEETAYLINKKANYRVIITEKNGEQKSYYKNSSSAGQLATLKNKYGYTFPTMDVFDRVPPPPPADPTGPAAPGGKTPPPPGRPASLKFDIKNPPPPPAPPKGDPDKDGVKPPPPPPSEVILNDKTQGKIKFGNKLAHTTLYLPAQNTGKIAPPLILVNGEKYDLKSELKRGQYLYLSASDSTIQHSPGEMSAMRKWGDNAKNGVIELYGKITISIK